MKKLTACLGTLLLVSAASAQTSAPQAISTDELAAVCRSRPGSDQHTYCDTYGQGVYDTYLVTRHPKRAPAFICVVQPSPLRSEVMDHFVEWVELNPAYDRTPAADSLLRFLATRFPCETPIMVPERSSNKVYR